MIRAFVSVGFWTLVSRVTGFVRDILLANILGAGILMDFFAVAFRLPNHFRAIFAEGAFNTAFVPAFTRIRTQAGHDASLDFQGRVLGMVLASQLLLLALVLLFTPTFVALLAPGFTSDEKAVLIAAELVRITFPYLALVTLVVLWSGVLNAEKRFFEGAAAPVLLNIAIITMVLLSTRMAGIFPSPAHAASWGVLLGGVLEALLLAWGAWRAGLLTLPRLPKLDPETRRFFKAFGPAVIGAAGVQIAMLADTMIVTFLPHGGASALYYADRLYQLPVGVLGVAAGTVLLPEMSRAIAAGEDARAFKAQNAALALTWLLATPFFVGFLLIPETIVAAMFGYGAFGPQAISSTSSVLFAYALGLLAIVGIRSVVASFHARGDTKTPLYASLTAIGVNLLLKLALWKSHEAAGLAMATALGAVLNFTILGWLAIRRRYAAPDFTLLLVVAIIATASVWLAAGFTLVDSILAISPSVPALARLVAYGLAGGLAYAAVILIGFRVSGLPLNPKRMV